MAGVAGAGASAADRPTAARVVASSGGVLAIGILPLFLVGALSSDIGTELGFGPAGTGVVLAVFFVSGGVSAVPVGWATDRLGPPHAMRVGATLSGTSSLLIGWWGSSIVEVAVALALAGVAIGFADTGASAWFAATIPRARQGIAFGFKEASVPTASLLAGLSLPALATSLDWRTVFFIAAALAPVVWLIVPWSAPPAADGTGGSAVPLRWGPLVVFALGIAAGTAGATAASTFLVPALEDNGWSSSAAGFLLAGSSVGSIVVRIVGGAVSDRACSVWPLVMAAMAGGAIGCVVLATDPPAGVVVAGALAAVALGWGWTGLAFQAVLVATMDRPALGAGLVLGGLSLGGAAGPAAFGALASTASFAISWIAAGLALAAGVGCTELARRATPPA